MARIASHPRSTKARLFANPKSDNRKWTILEKSQDPIGWFPLGEYIQESSSG